MSTPLTERLYLRIWLAVVLAVVVLTLLFGWFWHLDAERERAQRPGREIVLRNAAGEVLGQAVARPVLVPGQGLEFVVPTRDGQTIHVQLPRPGNRPPPAPVPSWWHQPYGLLWLFGLVATAVALGAYPIVRRLTKRLEALQQGVERWGEGDLSTPRAGGRPRRGGLPGAALQHRRRRASRPCCSRTRPCWPMPRTSCARRWHASAWDWNCCRSGRAPPPATKLPATSMNSTS